MSVLALLPFLLVSAQPLPPPQVARAIVRDSAEPGVDVAAYAEFAGNGSDDRLLSIECICASRVELHRVVRTGDAVSMETDWPLAIAASRATLVSEITVSAQSSGSPPAQESLNSPQCGTR